MMALFKRYLIDNEAKDFVNAVNLHHEIDVYHKTESKPKTKKDLQVYHCTSSMSGMLAR